MVAPTETTPEGSRPFHGDVIPHRFMRSKSLRFQPHLFCSGSARNKAWSSDACYCMNRASACGSWKGYVVVDLQALAPCKLIMARYFTLDDGLSFETCMGFLLVEHPGDAYYLWQQSCAMSRASGHSGGSCSPKLQAAHVLKSAPSRCSPPRYLVAESWLGPAISALQGAVPAGQRGTAQASLSRLCSGVALPKSTC